jgi:hypothetical protein
LISGSTSALTVNIYNLIGNFTITATGTDIVRRIGVISTGTFSIFQCITIPYLDGSTTSGTSGIYHAGNMVQHSKLDLRNNIIYNNSTGSGLAVAFRRSSANLQNYASSSNNNLFLGANLMNNGTAYSTLAAFKTIVSPRDAASISEVPVFFSTVGANATYLHVNGATKSQIESGGIFLVIPMTLMVIFDKGILAIAVRNRS